MKNFKDFKNSVIKHAKSTGSDQFGFFGDEFVARHVKVFSKFEKALRNEGFWRMRFHSLRKAIAKKIPWRVEFSKV